MKRFLSFMLFVVVMFVSTLSLSAQTPFGQLQQFNTTNHVSRYDTSGGYYEISFSSTYAVPPDSELLAFDLLGKTYSGMALPYAISADIQIIGNDARIAWSVDNGVLSRTTGITTIPPSTGFHTEIFPLVGVSTGPAIWQNLKLAISHTPTGAGLITVRIRLISALDQAGSLLYQIDNPTGGETTVPGIPILGSPADNATVQTPFTLNCGAVAGAVSYTFQISSTVDFSSPVINETVGTNSYTVSTLAAGTYYWRARANNNIGSSNFSAYKVLFVSGGGSTLLGIPEMVSPIAGAVLTGNQVQFLWRSVQNATSYGLQVSTMSDFSVASINRSGNDTSYSTILLANTQYYWRVNAASGGIASNWSASRSFTTGRTGGTITIPQFAGFTNLNSSVTVPFSLSWNANPSFGTRITLAPTNMGTPVTFNVDPGVGVYTITSLSAGTYSLSGMYTSGTSTGLPSNPITITVGTGPTTNNNDIPLVIYPKGGEETASMVTLQCYSNYGTGISFEFQVSEEIYFSDETVSEFSFTPWREYELEEGVHYWRVRRWENGVQTDWTPVAYFFVISGNNDGSSSITPILLYPINGMTVGNGLTFRWEALFNANDFFEVQVSKDMYFQGMVFAFWGTQIKSKEIYAVLPNGLYYWRVKKYTSSVPGNWSDTGYFIVVTVTDLENEIPTEFSLSQNYPNPFNPTTKIKYALPEAGYVNLKVYDMLGQEVAELINEVKSAGEYEVQFNASDFPSGIYIYRLQAEKFTEFKKMSLVK